MATAAVYNGGGMHMGPGNMVGYPAGARYGEAGLAPSFAGGGLYGSSAVLRQDSRSMTYADGPSTTYATGPSTAYTNSYKPGNASAEAFGDVLGSQADLYNIRKDVKPFDRDPKRTIINESRDYLPEEYMNYGGTSPMGGSQTVETNFGTSPMLSSYTVQPPAEGSFVAQPFSYGAYPELIQRQQANGRAPESYTAYANGAAYGPNTSYGTSVSYGASVGATAVDRQSSYTSLPAPLPTAGSFVAEPGYVSSTYANGGTGSYIPEPREHLSAGSYVPDPREYATTNTSYFPKNYGMSSSYGPSMGAATLDQQSSYTSLQAALPTSGSFVAEPGYYGSGGTGSYIPEPREQASAGSYVPEPRDYMTAGTAYQPGLSSTPYSQSPYGNGGNYPMQSLQNLQSPYGYGGFTSYAYGGAGPAPGSQYGASPFGASRAHLSATSDNHNGVGMPALPSTASFVASPYDANGNVNPPLSGFGDFGPSPSGFGAAPSMGNLGAHSMGSAGIMQSKSAHGSHHAPDPKKVSKPALNSGHPNGTQKNKVRVARSPSDSPAKSPAKAGKKNRRGCCGSC